MIKLLRSKTGEIPESVIDKGERCLTPDELRRTLSKDGAKRHDKMLEDIKAMGKAKPK